MSFKALLFDMDGTLQDSEEQTDQAIEQVMRKHGVPDVKLPPFETRGRSWRDVAHSLLDRHPLAITPAAMEDELLEAWRILLEFDLRPIPGSPAAIREASKYFKIAIVSSSPVRIINRFVEKFQLEDVIPPHMRVGADHLEKHKPHPEPWLLGAKRVEIEPNHCLVFEDSSAGLIAARAAGMHSVGILHVSAEPEKIRSMSDVAISHYEALPAGFWLALAQGGLLELMKLK